MEGNRWIPGFTRQERRLLKFTNEDMAYINSKHYQFRKKKEKVTIFNKKKRI